jgi:peptidoglycan/LPS O-acetylase OafA/YrhL
MAGGIGIVGEISQGTAQADSAPIPEPKSSLNLTRRIPELDGMRGAAIAMVVFVHYFWWAMTPANSKLVLDIQATTRIFWSAVDLFFVLSGFLIGGNLLDARDSPNYFSTFYIRRFCRVLPIYFLFLALVGLAYGLIYRPIGRSLDWVFAGNIPWYSYVLFMQNIWIAKVNNGGASILAPTWAFAVEVQFYLVVPALIRYVRKAALPYIFMSGIVIAPIVRIHLIHLSRSNLDATYVLLPCRMDSLFFGLLCAYYLRQPEIWRQIIEHRKGVWCVFFILLAGMPILSTKGVPFTLLWTIAGYGWMSLFYSTVLILAVTKPGCSLSGMLCWRWLTGLGTISYGVYLFHAAIHGLCVQLISGHPLLLQWKDYCVVLLALAISISIGRLSWRYVEKPMIRWGHSRVYGKMALIAAPALDIGAILTRLKGAPKLLGADIQEKPQPSRNNGHPVGGA